MKKWPILFLTLLLLTACGHHGDWIEGFAFRSTADGGWGIVATDGQILLPAGSLPRCPSAVVNGRFTLTDTTGYLQLYDITHPYQPVTHRRFTQLGYFFDEVTFAQELPGSPLMLIDRNGQTVKMLHQVGTYQVAWASNFSEGRALVATSQGKYGYLNTCGEWAVPPLYDRAFDFADGVALVGIANSEGEIAYRSIAPDGHTVSAIMATESLLYSSYSEGLLPFRNLSNGQCGYLDRSGLPQICLPIEVTATYPLRFGMAVVATAQGHGVINREGEWLLPPIHFDVKPLSHQRVALRSRQGWTLHSLRGESLCSLPFDTIGQFYHAGQAVVRRGQRYGWLPLSGDTTRVSWMHQLVEDPQANRTVPQRFSTLPQPHAHQPFSLQPDDEAEGASIDANPSHSSVANPTQRQTAIRQDAWREISSQSPFFEEAQRVANGRLEEQDAANRRLILNYVEHLRTAYTTKDIDFLEQLYSEKALIIVGTVVRTGETAHDYLSPAQVIYNVKSKRDYLNKLRQVFRSNQRIALHFSHFRILRHPTIRGIYGVSLRQGYRSDSYADEGYLFLLWDFRHVAMPQIHVRTWQPAPIGNDSLTIENEPLGLGDFNLQ